MSTGQRLDKWLFVARFARTRVLAAAMIADGRVRLRGLVAEKPSQTVRPGDVLTLAMGAAIVVVRIVAIGERRGSPAEAQGLFERVDLAAASDAAASDAAPRQSAVSP